MFTPIPKNSCVCETLKVNVFLKTLRKGENSVEHDPRLGWLLQQHDNKRSLTHSHTMTPFDAPGKQAF